MSWWQSGLLIAAVGVVIWFSASAVQRSKDEAEWASAKVHYDSLITQLTRPLPAVHDTIYANHITYRDDPKLRAWAESTVTAAHDNLERLVDELYRLSQDAMTDTTVEQENQSILGYVTYKSDVRMEYSPPHQRFMLALTNSRLEFPELTQTSIKTILIKPPWWEKPAGIIGGSVCGYGIARQDMGLAAIGGAVALITIAVDF